MEKTDKSRYNSELYQKKKEKRFKQMKVWRDNNPDKVKIIRSRSDKKLLINGIAREKYLERKKTRTNLRKNIIEKRKCCEVCNSIKNLEIHHKEYRQEQKYLILLCKKCHTRLHKEITKQEVKQNGR